MLVDKIVIKEEKTESCFHIIEKQVKIIPFILFFCTKSWNSLDFYLLYGIINELVLK